MRSLKNLPKKYTIAAVVAALLLATGTTAIAVTSADPASVEKIGPTYPIAEKHAIKEIMAKLQEKQDSGQLEKMQKEVQQRINHNALNLAPVEGLKTATKSSVHYFEPSYTLADTIYDQSGQIIAPAGTVIKPLEIAPIPFKMLFFDGRDPSQVALAKQLAKKYGDAFMPILTAGDWYNLSAEMNQAVYYDQQGKMTKSFELSEVPSVVSQEGKHLRIESIKP